jgi:hypothetical protein
VALWASRRRLTQWCMDDVAAVSSLLDQVTCCSTQLGGRMSLLNLVGPGDVSFDTVGGEGVIVEPGDVAASATFMLGCSCWAAGDGIGMTIRH